MLKERTFCIYLDSRNINSKFHTVSSKLCSSISYADPQNFLFFLLKVPIFNFVNSLVLFFLLSFDLPPHYVVSHFV